MSTKGLIGLELGIAVWCVLWIWAIWYFGWKADKHRDLLQAGRPDAHPDDFEGH